MVNSQMVGSFLLGTLLVVASAGAETVSAPMTVSAQVIGRAVLSVDNQPEHVVVTDQDVARGFVELRAPIQVRVRTNSRRGYVLQVNNVGDEFKAVELSSGSTTIRTVNEGWVSRPYVPGGDVMALKVRLQLREGTLAGLHQMPVVIAASAL